MTKKRLEHFFAALLFVLVMVVFSFAERDSKKLEDLYGTASSPKKILVAPDMAAHSQATHPAQ